MDQANAPSVMGHTVAVLVTAKDLSIQMARSGMPKCAQLVAAPEHVRNVMFRQEVLEDLAVALVVSVMDIKI